MRAHLCIALLLVVALLAVTLPHAAAGRRYKRRCDLTGCQRCYTSPVQGCYGKNCGEAYTCDANKCASGYTYSEESGMCDCKQGYGIVVGKSSYRRYRRQNVPGYSLHYDGYEGYNKKPARSYKAKTKGYGPGSYGYRPGMFVAGPYCQKCPRGYTSDGGEPMTTFCMPENSPGSIEVRSTPSGKNVPFQVAVSFDVPGGCDTTYKQVTVFVGSVPSGIRCDPVKLGSDCSAETTCEASKKGTFKLFASIKGVAGIVAGPTEVVVGGGGSGNDLPTNAVQLTIKTVFSATSLTRREALATAILDLIKAEVTGVNVRVFNIKEGSIVITFAVEGTPDQVAAALEAIQAALPGIASEVVAFLASQEPPILNEQGQPISEADVTVNILVNGEPFVPAPPPPAGGGSSPPPPPNPNVVVQASAVATVPTTALTAATETALEAAILDALRTLPAASALITATGASVDSLDLTPGSPTNVVVRITVRASFAPTVVATIQQAGNQNLIRLAVWNTVAAFFQQTRVEFPISINAGILAN